MNTRLLSLASAAILALVAAPAPAPAQQPPAAAQPGASAAVLSGRWLRDGQDRIIGSVKSVSPDGRTATVVVGVYFFDNVRVIEVPASALSVMDGRVTLRRGTVEVLNAPPSP